MNQYHPHPSEQLRDIRRMMERTSKFIGLSGLSGVAAGTFALIGAFFAQWYINISLDYSYTSGIELSTTTNHPWGWSPIAFFLLDALLVLVGALSSAIFFTTRRSQQKGQATWDSLTKRLLLNLAIPLAAGGVFCLALIHHAYWELIAPATLIFYGLAIINGSKYTLEDLFYLGLLEVGLGIIGLFFIGQGLLLWTIGFGVLHIVYGVYMYRKHERTT